MSGSELIVLLSAAGILARMVIRSQRETRTELVRLSTYVAVDKVMGPRAQAQLDEVREVVTENTNKIAVLIDRTTNHDRWHERHDHART